MNRTRCRTQTIFQMEATECGAASLAMVCSFWGKYIPLEQMRVETGVTRDGCNAGNLIRAAKRFGFESHGYRKKADALKDLPMPAIIHWNYNHFVVLEGFQGRYAWVNDPAIGHRRLTEKELAEGFSGIVMTFVPGEGFQKEKKAFTLPSMIRNRLETEKTDLLRLFLFGLLLVIPGLAIPAFSQIFLDRILGHTDISWFGLFLLALLAVILLQAFLEDYRSRLLLNVQTRLLLSSTRQFLTRLFKLPISFFSQRYPGDLVGRVDNNAAVNTFLAGNLAETALNLLAAVVYLAVLLVLYPALTGIGLIGTALNLLLLHLTGALVSEMSLKQQQDKGKLTGLLCSGLSITATLKASGAEAIYAGKILDHAAKADADEKKIRRVHATISALPTAVSDLITVALLMVGALFCIRGRMTPGALVAFNTLFASFEAPVMALVGFGRDLQTLRADIERSDDILRHPLDQAFTQEEAGNEKPEQPQKLSGRIDVRDLSFGYNPFGAPLITGFSFSLTPGKSVAFVGSSGCGKSTVSKLISQLYHPFSGEILLDGVPAEDIPEEVLHASIATVSQNIQIFSGTVRENLTMWNPSVLEKDLLQAAKDACIHDVILQKPGGYDYRLNEGGTNFSGGERQRIEIARALTTNPTILILDEATASLDPVTEQQILENIRRRGCTCIVIAHRLSAVRGADEILVMDHGQIIERGSHEILAAADGLYHRLMASE